MTLNYNAIFEIIRKKILITFEDKEKLLLTLANDDTAVSNNS